MDVQRTRVRAGRARHSFTLPFLPHHLGGKISSGWRGGNPRCSRTRRTVGEERRHSGCRPFAARVWKADGCGRGPHPPVPDELSRCWRPAPGPRSALGCSSGIGIVERGLCLAPRVGRGRRTPLPPLRRPGGGEAGGGRWSFHGRTLAPAIAWGAKPVYGARFPLPAMGRAAPGAVPVTIRDDHICVQASRRLLARFSPPRLMISPPLPPALLSREGTARRRGRRGNEQRGSPPRAWR
jgi:hypothetical protein